MFYPHIWVRPDSPRIMQPVAVNSIITGLHGVDLTLTCLSTGGYPQQTLDWYLVRNGQSPTQITNCHTHVASSNLYDATRTCTFTPTYGDDGATLHCQSSYSGDPQLKDSKEVQFEIGGKYTFLPVCVVGKVFATKKTHMSPLPQW